MQRSDVSALLLDVDGVLMHWPNAAPLDAGSKDGWRDRISAIALGQDLLWPLLVGLITRAQWRARAKAAAYRQYGPLGLEAFDSWEAHAPVLDSEVVATVRLIRPSVTVGLLTNTAMDLRTRLMEYGLLSLFSPILWSQELGVAKPDPAIFHAAIARLSVSPERVFFVDDSTENVFEARRIGMRAEVFRDADMLRLQCAELGLLEGPPHSRG